MLLMFLFLYLVVQLSFRGIEGDYQVLVSVHSLVLLESRCAECYDAGGSSVQRNSCCDFNTTSSSCTNSCDILLRFCQLSDLSQFNLADRLLGTQCSETPLFSHFEDFLGFNFKAGETYSNSNKEGLQGGVVFSSLVVYDGTGRWKGAQLSMSVVDRDPGGDIDDLIDYFSIPINISAGSLTSNFTGIYNYIQLELTIDVTCTAQNNTDESCTCLPGFIGPLCEPDINCTTVKCVNGGTCVAGSCSCSPAYTGATCESEIPGMEMITSSSTSPAAAAVPVAAIAGGAIGGLVAAFFLITLLLLFIVKPRTKAFAHNAQEDIDLHDYDEADDETIIETKECAAYAVQKKVYLENNPAYIIYAQVGGEQVTTIELRECVAYGTQGAVKTIDLEASLAYQTVTTNNYVMKDCPAYGTQERVATKVNPTYQSVTAHS